MIRPHDGRAETIGLGYDRRLRYDDPLSMETHAIVAIKRVPVDVLDTDAICERTAQAISARELIEPLLERRICVAAVKVSRPRHDHVCNRDKANNKDGNDAEH